MDVLLIHKALRNLIHTICLVSVLLSIAPSSLSAQSLIVASPDATICAPATVTLTAQVNAPPILSTSSYQITSIPYNPDPFTVGTQVFLSDDQFTGIIPMGFDFCFYGNTYNQLLISSNNYVSFDLTNANGFSPWSIPGPVPTPMNPMNTVLGPWQDINPGVGGQVYYNLAGTAPFRRFVVSYFNIPMFSCTGLLYSSQIILYETTNIIETHILNKPLCTTWNSGQAIHSLHNSIGTIADVVTGRNAPTQWTTANEGMRFSPSGPPAFQVNWLVNNTVVATGTSYTVSPTSTTTYVAQLVHQCTNNSYTDTVVVTAASNQPTTINGTTTVCPGDTASYWVPYSPTATYTWTVNNGQLNTGQGSNQILVTWTGPAPASVQVLIQDNGCTSNGNRAITLGQVVPVSMSGLLSSYCLNNQNFNLTGNPAGGTFAGPGISGTTFNPAMAGIGTHTITYTPNLPGNCSTPDTQIVTVSAPVTNNSILSSAQTVCSPNVPNVLTGTTPSGGSGLYSYQWQSNSGSGWVNIPGATQINFQPGAFTSLYRRIVGGAGACPVVTSTAVNVAVHFPIGNNQIGNSQTLCSMQAPSNLTGSLPTGGNGSFTYLWESSADNISWFPASGSNNTQNYNPPAPTANTYFRRIIVSGSCPPSISSVIQFEIYFSTTLILTGDTICEGQYATVSASATPAGGVYTWNTSPVQTTASISVNPQYTTNYAVQYVIGGCTITDSAKVVVYPLPAPLIQITGNTTFCTGDSVVLTALPAGGNYLWSNGDTTQSVVIYGSGTYSVQVTDPNGCPASSNPTITQAVPSPQLQLTLTQPSCFAACDGSILGNGFSGLPPYTITWNTFPAQYGVTATGLCSDTGSVVITDAAGCQSRFSYDLLQPTPLGFTFTSSPTSCFGLSDGVIQVNGTGGTPPYVFSLNNNPAGPWTTMPGLSAGTYLLTIRDVRNCQFQQNVVVQQPALLQASVAGSNPLCFGDGNGTATAVATGGTPPFSYLWNTGATTASISSLYAGLYSVQITDAGNCTAAAQVTLTDPPLLTASASGFDLTCAIPPDNGIATAAVNGGTAPYQYLWNAGSNPSASYNTGFPAGTWTVQITDANGCMTQASVVLNAPVFPTAYTAADTAVCAGAGGAPVSGWGMGGIPPYTYLWSPNNGSLNNANAAQTNANPDTTTTYYFQVIDDAGCASALVPQTVVVHPLPVVDAGRDTFFCENSPAIFLSGSVSPSGSYSVQWSPANMVYCDTCLTTYTVPPASQIYTLRATNRVTGCSSDSTTLNTLSSVVVTVKPRPVANAGPDTLICSGESAQLCGTAGNAGPAYTWFWQPALHINDTASQCPVVNPPATFTWFLVTQSDGCTSIADSVTVFVSARPTVDAGTILNVCAGDSVQLQGQVQNGLAQHYYWWPATGLSDSTLLQPMVAPVLSTWYYLQATHQGCAGNVDSVRVLVHARPVANAGNDTLVCGGGIPVTLQGSWQYSGNQPVYAQWQPGNLNGIRPVVSPDSSQLFFLTVKSGVAPTECVSTDSVLITVMPDVEVALTGDTTLICPGLPVQLTATGGIGSAWFAWSPDPAAGQQGTPAITVFPEQNVTYQVIASEAGCSDTATWSIAVHPKVEAFFNPSQVWGCAPFQIQFQNLSAGALSYWWDFGDSTAISNERDPAHEFSLPGVYYLRLIAIGVGGCRDTFDFPEPVRTGDSLDIQAYLEPGGPVELTLPMANIHLSTGPVDDRTSLTWTLGDGKSRQGSEVFYSYTDTGTYYITLTGEHDSRCRVEKALGPVIVKAPEFDIPNVFTPNGDGMFDFFKVHYTGDEAFYLVIYDRWGVTCFETYNKEQGWDGKDLNGQALPEGVYYYSVRFGKNQDTGNITLVR